MKKLLSVLLIVSLFSFMSVGCQPASDEGSAGTTGTESTAPGTEATGATGELTTGGMPKLTADQMKVGFIYIGSATDEGYTQAHDMGRQYIEKELGVKTMFVENIPETADCEKAARDLIDQGCNVIVGNSFGFMDFMLNVANENPDIYFIHVSGYKTAKNMSTVFGRVYQARYLSGIVAGQKTTANKIGYVAAHPIPEVVRGINAFTLGVRSVNPNATVEVVWTNTWYDPATEKSAAIELLNRGCDVIAQHQDTTGPQIAAQEKNCFAIGYNSPTPNAAPKAYLTAPLFNWGVIYKNEIGRILDGTWETRQYWGSMAEDCVRLDDLTANCAPDSQAAVDEAKQKIISGENYVFIGPLKDNTGAEKVAAGVKMTDAEMLAFDWFVDGVIGTIPK